MHIINAFLRLTSIACKRARRQWSGRRVGTTTIEETDSLLVDELPFRDAAPAERQATVSSSAAGAPSLTGHYDDFEHSWGALRVCFYHMMIYYAAAVIVYCFTAEGWPIVDAVYFATVLFTTIGYGDLHPDTQLGMLFTILLALYGVIILGLFLGIAGEALVASHNIEIQRERKKFRSGVIGSLRKNHKMRDRLQSASSTMAAINDEWEERRRLLDDIWIIVKLEAPIFLVVLGITGVFGLSEGWSLLTSAYWMIISGTTVGFGDFVPVKSSTRLAACFLLPLLVAVVGELCARVAAAYLEHKRHKSELKFLSRSMNLCDLQAMDADMDGKVDKAEFLAYMLVALQKVSKADIDDITCLFKQLDRTGTGSITKVDLEQGNWRCNFQASLRSSMRTPLVPNERRHRAHTMNISSLLDRHAIEIA